jgi:DNA-binding NtrC family response regulator
MSELQSELTRLRERVEQLERQHARTNRGRVNQRRAAEYLGCSREHLRQLHLAGKGPRRAADGTYLYDDLDSFAERRT